MYHTPMYLIFFEIVCLSIMLFSAVDSATGGAGTELKNIEKDSRAITAGDLLRLRTVTEIAVAADGSFAIYSVQSIHEKRNLKKKGTETYGYRTHLWRIDLMNRKSEPEQLTFGAQKDGDFSISRDGRWLAFVRAEELDDPKDEKKRKSQVWLLPLAGPGEARVVTDLEDGAGSPVWHPSGEGLLISSPIPFAEIEGLPEWDLERPGLTDVELARLKKLDASGKHADGENGTDSPSEDAEEGSTGADLITENDLAGIREWLNKNATTQEKPSAHLINRLHFQDELTLAGGLTFGHLFSIDLTDRNQFGIAAITQLTDGFHNHGGATYNADGSKIAFVDKPRGDKHPDRYMRSCIYVMNADGSGLEKVAGDEMRTFSQARFLPAGDALVATTALTDEMWYQQEQVARIDVGTGEFILLTEDWASSAGELRVMPQDGGLYFSSASEGTFPLRGIRTDANGSATTYAIPFEDNAGAELFDVGGGTIVAAVTTVQHPVRLVAIDTDGSDERVLHDLNPWVAERDLSLPTEHWLTQADGTRVQYWVMAPTGGDGIAKSPTVLEMHGGPPAMWGPGERSMWHEFQLLCAWGYGVVYANPRGSGGYGMEFQRGNHENWGVGPSSDVLAALDDAAKRYDWLDGDDLFVTGGSYAGYLTAWIVSHDDRFRAAVAQRGVYELNTFFGEGNAWVLVPWAMGGLPWEEETKEILDRESPFSYVSQIHTPLMIIHGSQDLRTGVAQSEMMFRALKELGREVEYIRYPGAGHELSRSGDPKQRMDRLLRIVEFFERYRD